MGWRDLHVLVLKPLCAVGFVGVIASALRVELFGLIVGSHQVWQSTLVHLLLATFCLCVGFLDGRGRNAAANHGGMGLLAGLLLGLTVAGKTVLGSRDSATFGWEYLLIVQVIVLSGSLVGAGLGLLIGVLRRRLANGLGGLVSPAGGTVSGGDRLRLTGVFRSRSRAVQFAIVGIGLGGIFLPDMIDGYSRITAPPTMHTLDVESLFQRVDDVEREADPPAQSLARIWNAWGVAAMAFSHDGDYLATAGYGRTIGIWNTADWTLAGEVPQSGRITQLEFSPDDQHLYVAGEDGCQPILCRIAWRTGERDRAFVGHAKRIDGLAVSTDGQTLLSCSPQDGILKFWDTTTATDIRSIQCRGARFVYASQRDFLFLWYGWGRGVQAYLAGERNRDFLFPANVLDAAFTVHERYLVTARRESTDAGGHEMVISVCCVDELVAAAAMPRTTTTLQERRVAFRRVVAETRFDSARRDGGVLAVSPDGEQVALITRNALLKVYSLPDLEQILEYQFACRGTQSAPVHRLSYSPDGKWIVAAQQYRTTPRLFDRAGGEERMPDEGHGDRVVHLQFTPDTQMLRSIGQDGTVCLWDVATLKMVRRTSVPDGRLLAAVRPSDGRYALCPDAADPQRPVQVIDLDTCRVVCDTVLPVTWGDSDVASDLARLSRVYWLDDQQALCTGRYRESGNRCWWRLDYRTGKILAEGRIDVSRQNALYNGRQMVSEDGKHLFFVDGGFKGSPPHSLGRISVDTLSVTTLGQIERPVNGNFGLVPGGKYFHLGLNLYDRPSLRLTTAYELPDDRQTRIGAVTFSPDGSRCAAILSRTSETGATETVVFLQETRSSQPSFAFRPATAVNQIQFSPDGAKLAVAYNNGTFGVRSVPDRSR